MRGVTEAPNSRHPDPIHGMSTPWSNPQPQAELGGVVLDVADVVDVQLGARELRTWNPDGPASVASVSAAITSVALRRQCSQVLLHRRPLVQVPLRPVLELLVVAERTPAFAT